MQVKKKELKSRILEEAAFLFVRKGIKHTTLKMIAERVHTTVSNIYSYFPSKLAILDQIAEEVAIEMDEFIEQNYKVVLEKAFEERFYEWLIKYVEEDVRLTRILGDKWLLLVDKCHKSKYEYYKDNLLEVLEHHAQCYLGETYSKITYRLIGQTFLQALIEMGKLRSVEIEMGTKMWDGRDEERGVRYSYNKFWRDEEKKQINCQFEGYLNMDEQYLEIFFQEYYQVLEGICSSDYSAYYDCRNIHVGAFGSHSEEFVRAYKKSNFKYNTFVFTHKQMTIVAQLEYVCRIVGLENYDIVIEHHVTRKVL